MKTIARRLCARVMVAAGAAWFATAFLVPAGADAQSYPSKPVRILVPAAVGGNPDILARLLADKLSAAFGGQSFVIDNVPGAGGIVAAEQLSKAPSDPHLMLLTDSGAMAIAVTLTPNISYDPLRDFTPITRLASVPVVLGVHPSANATSLAQFVAAAKAQPGKLNYGSAGQGSIHHLTMEVFKARAGIDLAHVAYRGGAPLVAALVGGEVQAGWSGIPNLQEPMSSGKVKGIAIATRERVRSTPDIPTVAEQGYPGFEMVTTMGMVTTRGASPEIVARLQAALAKAIREPDVAARMVQLAMNMEEDGTVQYTRFIGEDIERFRTAIKTAGIPPQ